MEVLFSIFIWLVILGVALTIGQFVLSLVFGLVFIAISMVALPFVWVYEKIKEQK